MRVVNLLEILRCYADAYVQGAQTLNIISALIAEHEKSNTDVRTNEGLLGRLRWHAIELSKHCDQLPMTEKAVRKLIGYLFNKPDIMATWTQPILALQSSISEIQNRLTDELSLNLFFRLPQDKCLTRRIST